MLVWHPNHLENQYFLLHHATEAVIDSCRCACHFFYYMYFAFSHLAQWQTHTRGGTQDLLGFEGACYTCKSQLVILEETLTERTEWLQRIGC